jgi:hypothetical protein
VEIMEEISRNISMYNRRLLNIKIVDKNGQETILDADESLQLIECVISIKVDEVYVNFAGHIVYLIEL